MKKYWRVLLLLCFIGQFDNLQAQEMFPKNLKDKTLLVMKWEEKNPDNINKYDYNHFVKFNDSLNYEQGAFKRYCKKYIRKANKNIEKYNEALEEEMKNYPYKYKLVTESELDSLYSNKEKYPYLLTKFYTEHLTYFTQQGTGIETTSVSFVIQLFIYNRSLEQEYSLFPKGKLTRLKNGFNTTYQTFISIIKE